MNEIITILSVIGLGALFALFGRKKLTKKTAPSPPENLAAEAAMDNVQEQFKEEIDRIRSATTGPSPADDLADLGNARRR
jgi:hypothetical protein|tara:strand:- start:110 stop:349 length:240 start_codon:yes stop_codon:yes gene_type:complete